MDDLDAKAWELACEVTEAEMDELLRAQETHDIAAMRRILEPLGYTIIEPKRH